MRAFLLCTITITTMLRYLENHGMYERDMADISDIDNDYEMELWVNVFVWNNVLYKGIES